MPPHGGRLFPARLFEWLHHGVLMCRYTVALDIKNSEAERKKERLLRLCCTRIWPSIPKELRGRPPISKAEKEAILGYGPEGF